MTRFVRFAITTSLLVSFVGLLSACAGLHLSDETGKAYRAAVAAQAESTAEPVPPMTAADARRVLRAHTGADDGSASGGGTGAASVPAVSFEGLSSGMSGGGMWKGASGGIRLEAK